ncbi:hypothetical protein PIROE2DRAFT_16389 [Piromyces sp. E2]|nr:hypothetical protein PIROE2DRAFT_16389 [Piromyces sp. E2]|eukprot:OUM58363.1 hypothetical protein PIROE2DRAFT_16389 [Piromyces sp. E2]
MDGSLNMDYTVAKLSRSIRLLSLYMMNDDLENANNVKEEIISNQLPLIHDKVMPFLKRDQETQLSSYPVIISSLDDHINRGINFYMNGYELYKKMDTLASFFVNLSEDDWYTICFYDENRKIDSNDGNNENHFNYNDGDESTESLNANNEERDEKLDYTMEQYYINNNKYRVNNQYNTYENDLYNHMHYSSYHETNHNDIINSEQNISTNEISNNSYDDNENNIKNNKESNSNNIDINIMENTSDYAYDNNIIDGEDNLTTDYMSDECESNNDNTDFAKQSNDVNADNQQELTLNNNNKKTNENINHDDNKKLLSNKNDNNNYHDNNSSNKNDKEENIENTKGKNSKRDIYGEVNRNNCNFLNDYRIRFFSDNIKDYVFFILGESQDRIRNEFTSNKNVYYILIIGSALFCAIISFFINLMGN